MRFYKNPRTFVEDHLIDDDKERLVSFNDEALLRYRVAPLNTQPMAHHNNTIKVNGQSHSTENSQ